MILFHLFIVDFSIIIVGVRRGWLVLSIVIVVRVFSRVGGLLLRILRRRGVFFLLAARLRLSLVVLFHARSLFVLLGRLVLLVFVRVVLVVPHAFVDDVAVVSVLAHLLLRVSRGILVVVVVVSAGVDVLHRPFEIVLHLDPTVVLLVAGVLLVLCFVLVSFLRVLRAENLILVFDFVGDVPLALARAHTGAGLIIHHPPAAFALRLLGRRAEPFGAQTEE